MAGGHGGTRPGAGRPHKDLDEVIGTRDVKRGDTIERVQVTMMDRIEEAIRAGAFMKDAAARAGITTETLREWRRHGVTVIADVYAGRKQPSRLTKAEKQHAELAARLETAEADARLSLLAVGQRLANGGQQRTETTEKRIVGRNGRPTIIEVTTRTTTAEPDARMIMWLLTHRWPEDFGRTRVELTGADGGPVTVDASTALDRLREVVEEVADRSNGHDTPAPNGSNGHR